MKLKTIWEIGKKFVVKNAPTILVGAGIVGSAGAVIFAIKDTPKAEKAIVELKDQKEDPNVLDKAKALAPIYWKTVLLWCLSSTCVIFSNHINLKRLSTMIALYKMAEGNKDKLEDAMRKILGDKKTEEVFDAARKEILKESPLKDDLIIQTGKGNTRFMDGLTRQRFNSSPQAVGEAFNNFNHRLMQENTLCVNDLLDELGILPMDPKYVKGVDVGGGSLGDRIGWRLDDISNLIRYKITYVDDEDGEPIGIVTYEVGPTMWFENEYYD